MLELLLFDQLSNAHNIQLRSIRPRWGRVRLDPAPGLGLEELQTNPSPLPIVDVPNFRKKQLRPLSKREVAVI